MALASKKCGSVLQYLLGGGAMKNYDFEVQSVRFHDTGIDVWLHILRLNKKEVIPKFYFMDLPPFYLDENNPFYNPTWKEKVYKFKHPLMTDFDKIPEAKKLQQLYFRGTLEAVEKELILRYETHQVLPTLEAMFKSNG